MTKTKRTARIALGTLLVVLGVTIWSLENSSTVGQGGWIRNFYFFVPGFACIYAGFSYLNLMVRSPHAAERSFISALAGKKDYRDGE